MGTIVSVGSGKGGVGKSVTVANLAAALAAGGSRVVMVDLDVGGANLAALHGRFDEGGALDAFWHREVATLQDAVQPISNRLGLVSGGGESLATANPSWAAKQRLLRSLGALQADFVLVDIGAGCGFHALDFFLAGEQQLVVTLPEPPAILDAYRFVKLAAIRAVSRALSGRDGSRAEVQAGLYREAQELIDQLDPESPRSLPARSALEALRPQLVVNRSDGRDLPIQRLRQTVQRFLGRDFPVLGRVPEDVAVVHSVAAYLPVVDAEPRCPAAYAYRRAAQTLHDTCTRVASRRVGAAPLRAGSRPQAT